MIAQVTAWNFEIELELADGAKPRGELLVISRGDRLRGIVRCCSAELTSRGLVPGDRVSNARRRFPNVTVRAERPLFYEKMSLEVTGLLVNRTPAAERLDLNGWVIDLTGCDRLFRNNFLEWARHIAGLLKSRFGLTVGVGLGSNKVMAEFACRLVKPGHALQLFGDEDEMFMGRASLDLIPGLANRQREYLRDKRLEWMWELRELGEDRLRQWFGNREGSRVWDVIHGRCVEPVKPFRMPRFIKKSYTFPEGVSNMRDLVQAGLFLTDNLCHDVEKAGGVLRKVSCRVTYTDDHFTHREIHLVQVWQENEYAEMVRRMLENLPMRRVRMRSLSLWCPVDFEPAEQHDMFAEREQIKRSDLDQALKDVRDKYGFQYLHRAGGTPRRETQKDRTARRSIPTKRQKRRG